MKDWKLNQTPLSTIERFLFVALIALPIVGIIVALTLF